MKNKKLIFLLLALLIILIPFTLLYFKNIKINEFKYKTYGNIVEQAQLHLQTLIKEKQNTTATIGLGLSTSDNIIEALEKKDSARIDLKAYSLQLKKSSDFKNVWFQLITKDGISLQRSWSSMSGDNISNFRVDLNDVLEYPRLLNSISVGIFDMTFKSIVPVYSRDKRFLGVIEVITHFNSISKKLKEKGVDSVILADKKYKSQLKKPFTEKFIDEYYVANMDVEDTLLLYFKNNDIEKYIEKIKLKRYYLDEKLNKVVTYYYLTNLQNDVMGHFILFIDRDKIDIEKINEIEYIYNLYIVLSILSVLIFGYLIYSGMIKSSEINYRFSNRLLFIIILSYLLLVFIFTKLIELKYQGDIEFYKSQLQKESVLDFNAINDKNKVISNLLFANTIDNKKIKRLLKEGKREDLYEAFLPIYKDIQLKYNIRQVHFHLPESVSFLRMHRPNKFGDSLKGVRNSIDYVQKYYEPFEGFEEGRIYNGFRYVYPLFLDKEFIGSVEVSFDIYSIMDNYFKLYNIDRMNFLLSEKVVEEKVFKSEQSNYIKSPVEGFYFDKLIVEKLAKDSKFIVSLENSSEKVKLMSEKIKKGVPFVIHFDETNQITIVLPFINKITGDIVASLNISKDDTLLKKLKVEEVQIKITVYIALAFLMIFIYREIIAKQKVRAELNKNQKILDSQRSFIIITDGINLKTSNQSMLNFLGFNTLVEFKHKHKCICEFFEYEEGKNYIQEDMHGKNWFEYLKTYEGSDKIVKISDNKGSEHLFYIEFDKGNIIDGSNYIITFIDITKLKNMEGQLIQSEKMGSLGKMIGNIAHQWRQPLSVISIAASGLKLKDEFGKLDSENLHKNLDMIISNSKYLSETIDTFRDLVKDKKIVKDAHIQDILDGVINIMNVSFNNKNIQLIENIDYETDMTKKLVVGELSQVVTNILNNAADIMVHRSIKNPQITIECYLKDEMVYITVEDNAGGIPDDIINNIFDPYFTTKHQSQGTGLGLYMSHKIVEESLKGKLYVRNTQKGAKFYIEFSI